MNNENKATRKIIRSIYNACYWLKRWSFQILLIQLIGLSGSFANINIVSAQSTQDTSYFLKQAETAYSQNRFDEVLLHVERIQGLLGETTDSLQYLKVKALYELGERSNDITRYQEALDEIKIFEKLNTSPELQRKMFSLNRLIEKSEKSQGEIYVFVEKMPVLIGGIQSLHSNINYPNKARRKKNKGTVVLKFVVNEEGDATNIRVIRGIEEDYDQAVVEAMEKAKFIPGMQNGRNVKVEYSMPIPFKNE